jgi:hypothetical protein
MGSRLALLIDFIRVGDGGLAHEHWGVVDLMG